MKLKQLNKGDFFTIDSIIGGVTFLFIGKIENKKMIQSRTYDDVKADLHLATENSDGSEIPFVGITFLETVIKLLANYNLDSNLGLLDTTHYLYIRTHFTSWQSEYDRFYNSSLSIEDGDMEVQRLRFSVSDIMDNTLSQVKANEFFTTENYLPIPELGKKITVFQKLQNNGQTVYNYLNKDVQDNFFKDTFQNSFRDMPNQDVYTVLASNGFDLNTDDDNKVVSVEEVDVDIEAISETFMRIASLPKDERVDALIDLEFILMQSKIPKDEKDLIHDILGLFIDEIVDGNKKKVTKTKPKTVAKVGTSNDDVEDFLSSINNIEDDLFQEFDIDGITDDMFEELT